MKLLVNTKDLLGYVVHDNEKDIADLHGSSKSLLGPPS